MDDMKVQVDITADLSKLDSSLNLAEQKTAASGRRMQSSLNLQPGSGGVAGPGGASVAPGFSSNQIAFGNGLNVQRASNYGYGSPIGPAPAPSRGAAGYPSPIGPMPAANPGGGVVGAVGQFVAAGQFATLAQMARIAGSSVGAMTNHGGFAVGNAGSDPILAFSHLESLNDSLKRFPVVGEIVGGLQGMTGTDPGMMGQRASLRRQAAASLDIAQGMGGYNSQRASLKLRQETEMRALRKTKSIFDPTFNSTRDSMRRAQAAERSNLEFERKWDLRDLDVAAGAETLRMFGSDFAADQMTIGARFDKQIETANRAKDTERSGRLARLKQVSLLSSAIANMGESVEMSGQGSAFGGARLGQYNPNDPAMIRMMERVAIAVEENAGGVPLAR